MRFIILTLVLSISTQLSSQELNLPNTNLYLFTFTATDASYSLRYPKFLTGFNEKGYNNQPAFLSDFDLYISSDYGDNGSVELLHLNLFDKEFFSLTDTEEMEFSPTPVKDGVLSSVRIEQDNTTQTLVLYKNDMSEPAKRVLANTGNIGYHCWLNSKEVALYLIQDEVPTLAIANIFTEKMEEVASYIGRTLKKDKNGKLYFIDTSMGTKWFIKRLDPYTLKTQVVVETLEDVEDFELMTDGTIVAGKGSRLFYYKPGKTAGWTIIKDLKEYGISDISRIAIRKNKLVLANTQS